MWRDGMHEHDASSHKLHVSLLHSQHIDTARCQTQTLCGITLYQFCRFEYIASVGGRDQVLSPISHAHLSSNTHHLVVPCIICSRPAPAGSTDTVTDDCSTGNKYPHLPSWSQQPGQACKTRVFQTSKPACPICHFQNTTEHISMERV